MNFELDSRDVYLSERRMLKIMPLKRLKGLVAELHKLVYEENDTVAFAYHRLASSVLVERERTGETLIFHLKTFRGVLLVSILFTIFRE